MKRTVMQSVASIDHSGLGSEAALTFACARPFFVGATSPSPAMSFFASEGSKVTFSDAPTQNASAANLRSLLPVQA